MKSDLYIGLLLPLAGTTLGAGTVLFMKHKASDQVERILLGFAAGVMIAASVWSLLLPSIEMAEGGEFPSWVPASTGFLGGIFFLLLLDSLIPHLHFRSEKPEGIRSKLKKTTMLVFAVTLHNIPEGMAVGVIFAGAAQKQSGITMAGAYALAAGIAIQNFPEGAIISMPLREEGLSKRKAFLLGFLSGIVEPAAAIVTISLTRTVVLFLPYLLSFAAGAMMYVVIEELIPESQSGGHSNVGTLGAAAGFVIMMVLDVALG